MTDIVAQMFSYGDKKVRDIVKLTPQQFEFFIDDLREYCNIMRPVEAIGELPGVEVQDDGTFDWIDNGYHSSEIKVEANIKNNI